MIILQMAALGTITALFLAWRWPGLRWQAIMLAAGVGVALWTMGMDNAEKSIYRIILDTVCVIGGAVVAFKYEHFTGTIFSVLSGLCIAAHTLFFTGYVIGQPTLSEFGLNATLDVLFFLMLAMVGGTGYVRCHRDIRLPSWLSGLVRHNAKAVR